jgi:hypothetical protein
MTSPQPRAPASVGRVRHRGMGDRAPSRPTKPLELTPGLERIAVGQTLIRIFELVEVEYGRHLTAQTISRHDSAGVELTEGHDRSRDPQKIRLAG